jgi:outer membrane protein OmpA-like peptidoglycan-associated protein
MPTPSLLLQAQQAGPKSQPSGDSPLSFASSNTFREELMLKNLKPYNFVGLNPGQQGTVIYQQTLPDLSSPDVLYTSSNNFLIYKNDSPGNVIVPSSYKAYNILNSNNPQGDSGSLSQDSYIAKIGSQVLQDLLLFNNGIFLGNNAQSESTINFGITTPNANDTYLSKLEGSYIPSSPIEGNYFLDVQNRRGTTSLGEGINLLAGRSTIVGGLFDGLINRTITPSQKFLVQTESGQKSIMFENLSYNIFRPAYGQSLLGGLAGNALTTFANSLLDNLGLQLPGAYYVGSVTSEPSYATSPIQAMPIDIYGKETQAIVYGPDVLGKDYEGNEGRLNFGLVAKPVINQGSIDGEFVWVSPKYKGNVNAEHYSTNIPFKPGSILDDTQRMVNAADNVQGEARFRHAGNAINQVSRIFNDGYKQMTKGSQVVTYKDPTFETIVGEEYCRIFTKDRPYSTYPRLQKTDGIVNYGRRFNNSVLDNTFNLNISPTKGSNQSYLSNNKVKKYMFSIENLAWKSSKRPGYNVQDLPLCERGPNGGRIMWFPPYDLKFNDNSTANWNDTTFLGRPEPVYTYKSTSRNGTLTWKIIVDHPSVLNIIVDKLLAKETGAGANRALESFFAGCQKYDLYDLAIKFNTTPLNKLQYYQDVIQRGTTEEITVAAEAIEKQPVTTQNADTVKQPEKIDLSNFLNLGFYFHNDVPPPHQGTTADGSYYQYYLAYKGLQSDYANKAINNPDSVNGFFSDVLDYNFNKIYSQNGDDNLMKQLYKILSEKRGKITIEMEGSASASAPIDYNDNLSARRIDSVIKFFKSQVITNLDGKDVTLEEFMGENPTLIINPKPVGEKATNVTPVSSQGSGDKNGFGSIAECTVNPNYLSGNNKGKKMTDKDAIYTIESMSCRSVRIKTIKVEETPPEAPAVVETKKQEEAKTGTKKTIQKPDIVRQELVTRPGLSKKVLRDLLTECDYFEAIKEESPFVYDSLKEKLKFFNPAFHSMTPEGLNARLTFLNQCLRPGDTIPTIDTEGKPVYNDAINTAFGTPPVLVLRIGDFYNTKIIPRNLQISYEPLILDLNPEGIGVQPMLANVTLSFDFIGGHGLARPVEELQNALSFNYYANTEIYDERATATEDVSKLDQIVLQGIKDEEIEPPVVQNKQQNAGGSTIGVITKSNVAESGETGTISYRAIMKSLVDEAQNYFGTVVGKCDSIATAYNYGILQIITSSREYTDGNVATFPSEIFGKVKDLENGINKLFDGVISDITNNDNVIISGFLSKEYEPDGPVIGEIKNNMITFIKGINADFVSGLNIELQLLLEQQQKLINIIDKLNFVVEDYDGKIKGDGSPLVYNVILASVGDFISDIEIVGNDLKEFMELLGGKKIITPNNDPVVYPTKNIEDKVEQEFFKVVSQTFLDKNKLEQFKNALLPNGNTIGGVTYNPSGKPDPLKLLEKILGLRTIDAFDFNIGKDSLHEKYTKEQRQQNRHINEFRNTNTKYIGLSRFYKPFNLLTNERVFDYSSTPDAPDTIKKDLTELYGTVNSDGPLFNGKKQLN